MNVQRVTNFVCLTVLVVFVLGGCAPLIFGAAGGGVLLATDRRSIGSQTEDYEIQVKATVELAKKISSEKHVNVASFNRRVLLTGEVSNQVLKDRILKLVHELNNVREIVDELVIKDASSFRSRSNDAWITSKVKAALINTKEISANVFKVVTERGDVYLMGIVSAAEGKIASDVASRVNGVRRVIKLYEYLSSTEAKGLAEESAKQGMSPDLQDETVEVTTTPISSGSVTQTPLTNPASIIDGEVKRK
ncbi:BON domain-containing protein [Candidatus Pandoraea novymonadis]|uniref:BON domain-containing protein n=1 Tax=Candidatus Pandoraea novymonadis TaxID=1808959 RepID=A0ABX5FFF9_9BURK|nr:BON domain-containing protein [Candidatus Pandoraea novymonadis]PSB92449.1 hypothetical protein BZL35_00692 [Candidatus Pandoraea novymonadis]